MRAGTEGGLSFESWDHLIDELANGYTVVVLLENVKRDYQFARVIGPFATKKEARNKAATARRKYRVPDERYPDTRFIGTRVEPLWKDLFS